MKIIWAPWRMKYVQGIGEGDTSGECIFCIKPKQNADRENLILHRGARCFIILNLYPYTNGHLLVVPYRHTANIGDLNAETACELWELVNMSTKALTEAFHPDGFNIGMNIGRTAGAGIDRHIHMHIVPRWNGDTNFLPVIGGAKVISQGVLDTYDALRPYFAGSTTA